MPRSQWVPLLDAVEDTPLTVEAIGQMTSPDELRAAWLKVQEMPLSSVERSALQAAVYERASDLNLSSWDFQPYDNGAMMATATAMQDSVVRGTTAVVELLDASPGKPLRFRFKGSEAGVISGNNRVYLPEILTDAVSRFNADLAKGLVPWGEGPHPQKEILDAATGRWRYKKDRTRATIMPERAFMQGSELMVDGRVIEDTTAGRQLAADLRNGRPIFFSTRAYGDDMRIVPLADGRQVMVPMKMNIETWDRVDNPAIHDASPVAMLDSVQMQAILDSVQGKPAPAPATNTTQKGESTVKWSKALIDALKGSKEGRAQILTALTDATVTLEAEIRTAMTDALAELAPAPAPAAAPVTSQEAIQQAVTDALNRANEEATQKAARKAEAQTWVKEQLDGLKTKNAYPVDMLDSISQDLADVPDKTTAEVLYRQAVRMADSAMTTLKLGNLGYTGGANGAALTGVQVTGSPQPWKPLVDNLMKSFDEFRLMNGGGAIDPELRKVNAPFVAKLLAKFDAIQGKALLDSVAAFQSLTDSITQSDLYTQAIIQRVMMEQAFGDTDMLQYLFTDTIAGDQWKVPIEYFEAPTSVELDTPENGSMTEAEMRTAWMAFSPTPRRVRIEVSNDVQYGMRSGPLSYDTAARAMYHITQLVKRTLNIAAGNEMLRASDAYGAVAVSAETVAAGELATVTDGGNTKYKITLRRGGATGELTTANTDRPVVRPRKYKSIADLGAISEVAENTITVTIGGTAVTAGYLRTDSDGVNWIVDAKGANITGYAVDYENGYVYVSDDLTITPGTTECVIAYSYGTNFTVFNLNAGSTDPADHYNGLLRTVGFQSALMAAHPRYMKPNLALGSLTAMEYVVQASLFYQQNSPKGTVLNSGTQNYLATRNGVDYASHNTRWSAGDSRILLGRIGGTKYGVRDPLKPHGPFTSYDANMKVLPGQQWYAEEFSALFTPEVRNQAGVTLNPYYRTVKLVSR